MNNNDFVFEGDRLIVSGKSAEILDRIASATGKDPMDILKESVYEYLTNHDLAKENQGNRED